MNFRFEDKTITFWYNSPIERDAVGLAIYATLVRAARSSEQMDENLAKNLGSFLLDLNRQRLDSMVIEPELLSDLATGVERGSAALLLPVQRKVADAAADQMHEAVSRSLGFSVPDALPENFH